MLGSLSETMVQRYEPQFQQFGLSLSEEGTSLFGSTHSPSGEGRAWVMPISEHCMVLEHAVVPSNDMQLLEITPKPYACISEISAPTLTCMNETRIDYAGVGSSSNAPAKPTLCTFVHQACEEEYSPLRAGCLYYSRSIIFEPEYFSNLEKLYPGQFAKMFNAFSESWNDQAYQLIFAALRNLNAQRSLKPGAHLYAQSTINALLANLSMERQATLVAEKQRDERQQKRIAQRAANLVQDTITHGEALTITDLAAELFVSRSTLCAAFKQETGMSIGSFARSIRDQEAEKLLTTTDLTITQIAARLGFTRQSAFTQSFKQSHGAPPALWREQHR